MRKNLEIIQELKKASGEREIFYRYRIGEFVFWFSQDMETGNIYSVAIFCKSKEFSGFELFIYCDDAFYPSEFLLSCTSQMQSVSEAREYADKIKYLCIVLDKIEQFFKTSSHSEYHKAGKKRDQHEKSCRNYDKH